MAPVKIDVLKHFHDTPTFFLGGRHALGREKQQMFDALMRKMTQKDFNGQLGLPNNEQ